MAKRWAELTKEEWGALEGIAAHPEKWGRAVPTGAERREGEFGPEYAALLKLRDLGLIDFVAPREVEGVATCSVTELGREALSSRRSS